MKGPCENTDRLLLCLVKAKLCCWKATFPCCLSQFTPKENLYLIKVVIPKAPSPRLTAIFEGMARGLMSVQTDSDHTAVTDSVTDSLEPSGNVLVLSPPQSSQVRLILVTRELAANKQPLWLGPTYPDLRVERLMVESKPCCTLYCPAGVKHQPSTPLRPSSAVSSDWTVFIVPCEALLCSNTG